MEHQCLHMASTDRRHHVARDTSSPALAGQRGSCPLVRTLSSCRAAADCVRTLVLTLDSDSPCARTPRAASALSHDRPITRSCFSRPSLHQTAPESVCSVVRVRARRGVEGHGAAHHHEESWGATRKQQFVSIAAPASAPAPASWPHEPVPAAVLQPSPRRAVRVVRQTSTGPSAGVLASPVKCVRAQAAAAGSSSSTRKGGHIYFVCFMCARIDPSLHRWRHSPMVRASDTSFLQTQYS